MVESSDTKKVAMLATQNTGQGEVDAGGVGVSAGVCSDNIGCIPCIFIY
jgi:hypothetical protein